MEFRLKTLSPIWTGGIDQKCDKLHETGIIGSLRWWYEALVRGLGGNACDPSDSNNRCMYDTNMKQNSICVACNLFGCTGWSRKFRIVVVDSNNKLVTSELQKDMVIVLKFIELKPLFSVEKWLIYKTLWLISEYGSIGGKTIFKPSEDTKKQNKFHHQDFGLISLESTPPEFTKGQKETVQEFFKNFRLVSTHPEWPNLNFFFFAKGQYLTRLQMNNLMGLSNDGKKFINQGVLESYLKGEIGKSKKIFSFQAGGGRIWGYVKYNNMLSLIEEKFKDFGVTALIKGSDVIEKEL